MSGASSDIDINESVSGLSGAPYPFKLIDKEGKEHEFLATALDDVKHDTLDNWVRSQVIQNAVQAAPTITAKSTPQEIQLRKEIMDAAIQASVGFSIFNGPGSALLNTPQGLAQFCFQLISDNLTNGFTGPEHLINFFRIPENQQRLSEAHKVVNPGMTSTIDDEGDNQGN